MCRIISNSRGQPLKNTKVLLSKDYSCEICSQGNLFTQPSMTKVNIDSSSFLQKIQTDIYGLIMSKKWAIQICYGLSGCIM